MAVYVYVVADSASFLIRAYWRPSSCGGLRHECMCVLGLTCLSAIVAAQWHTVVHDEEVCSSGAPLRRYVFFCARSCAVFAVPVACRLRPRIGRGGAVRPVFVWLCVVMLRGVRAEMCCFLGAARGLKAGSKYAARFGLPNPRRKTCPPTVGGQRFGYAFVRVKRASFLDRVCGPVSGSRTSSGARVLCRFLGRLLRPGSGSAFQARV